MSAIKFTAIRFDVDTNFVYLNVEITRDGEIRFLNYDIEYDLAMVEFGEPTTPAVNFFTEWRKNRAYTILKSTNLLTDKNSRMMLLADFADHVLPVFKNAYPIDLRIEDLIGVSRKYAMLQEAVTAADTQKLDIARWGAIGIASMAKEKSKKLRSRAYQEMNDKLVKLAAKYRAARQAAEAAVSASIPEAVGAVYAATAAAHYAEPLEYLDKWHQAHNEESLWQLRRFFDVYEAIQAGRQWPPLEVTS